MDDNTTVETKTKKKNPLAFLLVFLFILSIGLAGTAFAKYITTKNGTGSIRIANMICNLEVVASSTSDPTIVDPYCTVTITNFNEDNNTETVSEVVMDYTVTVSLAQGSELTTLPAYYWEDSNGNRVGTTSQPLTGTIGKGTAETQTYTVYFVNTGSSNITGDIDFNITAIQKNNN